MSIGIVAADGKSIECSRCHRTSHNLNDVVEAYCGHCHIWHETIVDLLPEPDEHAPET